eukprot:TRINITY_DN66813_c0_g1_i1.p1 TRINITY_DN66813_c0_g1~~TRINITY_DN66813_c0_g1_i1.p1  ORF type:complete len:190 (-),score=8.35 TRINITY_DN66813_c0_g1_i1:78-647(-)
MGRPGRGGRGGAPRGGFGGRGGGRGGPGGRGGRGPEKEPPDESTVLGKVISFCEDQLVCKITSTPIQIPMFNANMWSKSMDKIGKIDEIFGTTSAPMFTVQPVSGKSVADFSVGDEIKIGTDRLMPLYRFTTPAPSRGRGRGGRGDRGGRGGDRGGRGGRGDFRGGRGGDRGGRGGGRGDFRGGRGRGR